MSIQLAPNSITCPGRLFPTHKFSQSLKIKKKHIPKQKSYHPKMGIGFLYA